eukprot:CAMPEP_0181278200 /NCGR_PEP_ID=MMETSP1097-20121128/11582_1 /TAXON_ID=35684 /ORGANISM="Pseudopedinella elastica, Strain CCMP716" /LENGTH=66 /DNA_ID=CAMNT_0023380229 /DNA_START=58 /DNA_END=255 /DNA_ORIENTATION=-
MHQPHFQVRQSLGKLLGSHLRGLTLQSLGLLDQSAHPIGLSTFPAGAPNPFNHIFPAAVGNHDGFD